MENATKALLIAAAVLVAILIISLGLAVYNKASNATDSADLSATEIQAQNEKFLKYEGTNRRGSEVNALLETVLNSNLTAKNDGAKISVTKDNTDYLTKDAAKYTKVDTSKLYTITCNRDKDGGNITSITITTKNTPNTPAGGQNGGN